MVQESMMAEPGSVFLGTLPREARWDPTVSVSDQDFAIVGIFGHRPPIPPFNTKTFVFDQILRWRSVADTGISPATRMLRTSKPRPCFAKITAEFKSSFMPYARVEIYCIVLGILVQSIDFLQCYCSAEVSPCGIGECHVPMFTCLGVVMTRC